MATRIVMPPLGETMDEGTIVRWLKAEGDPVAKGDQLFEVETDKVIIPVESFGNGILRKIIVGNGETAAIGTLVGIIAAPDEKI